MLDNFIQPFQQQLLEQQQQLQQLDLEKRKFLTIAVRTTPLTSTYPEVNSVDL